MLIHNYIKKNWETLPKSKFGEEEIVIFLEECCSEEGWGHHSYEGYGVDKTGKYRWMFSSGCSCSGGPYEQTIKGFVLDDGKDFRKIKPSDVDFQKLQVEYSEY